MTPAEVAQHRDAIREQRRAADAIAVGAEREQRLVEQRERPLGGPAVLRRFVARRHVDYGRVRSAICPAC